ncbi:AAA family ATPase [Pseudomonas syringae USA007]|uniref:AAA family ATPase n=1 Tax=Pseudomonas syringae USA007 TaxID=1357288 RepID=A0AAU8MA83_PSESX|nr:AAA family ATPase [Pseudomonas syringae]
MKIVNFKVENYKAFEEFSLTFKPLTILLGSNSSGKSAILNCLLMLSQSADSKANQASDITFDGPLRLNGNKIGLGETLNIFPSRNTSKEISATFSFSSRSRLTEVVRRARESSFEILFYVQHHCLQKLKEHAPPSAKLSKLIIAASEFRPSRQRKLDSAGIQKFTNILCDVISLYRKLPEDIREDFFEGSLNQIITKASLARIK